MNIRPALSADFSAIAVMQTESWKTTYTEVLPEKYLSGQLADDLHRHWLEQEIRTRDVILIAENGGYLGFVAVWCRPDPFIDNLHVMPSQRSVGVGSALMKAAAVQLLAQGQRNAYLWVAAGNARAIRFYEKLGGVLAEQAVKNLFGNDVPTIKIEWPDIAIIIDAK